MSRLRSTLKAVGVWLGNVGHWLGAVLLIALFVFVGWLSVRGPLIEFFTGQRYLGEFFILTVMMSVYVLTFLAYRAYRSRARLERLKEDLVLLGVPEEKIDTLYGQAQSTSLYLLTITLATAFTVIGLGLFFWPPATDQLNANTLQAMRYGFLGGYVFSLQLIYRRYTTDDLQPAVYLYCAFAIVMGLIFNLVALEALQNIAGSADAAKVTGIGAGLLAILAFSLGYFPSLAISWFNRISYRALGATPDRSDEQALGLIDGISSFHEVRLRDNGVDNVQNLAAVDIVTLLVNSSFSVQQVIDWVDQAILYLYLDIDTVKSFRRAGIRSASDFKDRWEGVLEKNDAQLPVRFAEQLQSTKDRLDTLDKSLVKGPNLHYVEPYWRMAQASSEQRFQTLFSNFQGQAVAHRTDQKALSELKRKQDSLKKRMVSAGIQPAAPDTAEELVGQGLMYEQDGQKDQATKSYRDAIALNPDYAEAYNSLAWLYARDEQTSNYADALKLAARAVDLQRTQNPDGEEYAAYLDTLATVQMKLNQLDDAARNLQEASNVQNVSETGRQYIQQHLREVQELRTKKPTQ